MSTTALHLTLNISETVRDRFGSKGLPTGNGIWAIEWSRDRWRHVTLKGQTRDLITLNAQYLEKTTSGIPSGRTNNFPESERGLGHVTPTIFDSTVGYPSDSLASCLSTVFQTEHRK